MMGLVGRDKPGLPMVATLVVLLAAGLMVWLGFWQLRRLTDKQALLERYAAAQHDSAAVTWPRDAGQAQLRLYRHADLMCTAVRDRSSMAGRNAMGETGVSQTAHCALADGGTALVVMGWSRQPNSGAGWQGGPVHGVIAPGPRLVADPPLAGLAPNALPDPSQIPNNHLSYAIQWFSFAASALVIYVLALRRRRVTANR